MSGAPLLEVDCLRKEYGGGRGFGRRAAPPLTAVSDVSFQITRGETFGLVGESGCGKSTIARCVSRLTPVTAGRIVFDGEDLTTVSPERMRQLRRSLQIVFQDVTGALDSRMTIAQIVEEPLKVHHVGSRAERRERTARALELVGIATHQLERRPLALSGGQRQRVGLARALVLEPELVILDEPVSAVDVSVQAQILNLLSDLQRELTLTYLLIVHDLAVAEHVCDRIAVLYLGRIVESAASEVLFAAPLHPYTVSLFSAAPVPDPVVERKRARIVLTGEVDHHQADAGGCVFRARCPVGRDRELCARERPALTEHAPGHALACHFPGELAAG
jgi:oligopeptide/dipeptide ABC transporter ATP-binding protein